MVQIGIHIGSFGSPALYEWRVIPPRRAPVKDADDPLRLLLALPRPPSDLEPNSRCERCLGEESCDRSSRHPVPCRFSDQGWVPPAKAAAEGITQDDATRTVVAYLTDPGTTGGIIA
jgi:hypothetical protein